MYTICCYKVVDVATPANDANCANTKVYIADVSGYAILVYDWKQNRAWKVQNQNMNPNRYFSRFTIAGQSFDLQDGVFGLALSPRVNNGYSSSNYTKICVYVNFLKRRLHIT